MRVQNKLKEFNFASVIFVLLCVFIGFQNNGFAQDDSPDEIIRVNTNLVTIPATVLDREGRYVTNLKKENFQLFEDGVEQEIALFEPVEQPFTVFILFDRSGSMSNKAQLARDGNALVSQLRTDDQVTRRYIRR